MQLLPEWWFIFLQYLEKWKKYLRQGCGMGLERRSGATLTIGVAPTFGAIWRWMRAETAGACFGRAPDRHSSIRRIIAGVMP
ncbi:MAG: hypothetical protein ABI411_05310 [Tahibacter sp.]